MGLNNTTTTSITTKIYSPWCLEPSGSGIKIGKKLPKDLYSIVFKRLQLQKQRKDCIFGTSPLSMHTVPYVLFQPPAKNIKVVVRAPLHDNGFHFFRLFRACSVLCTNQNLFHLVLTWKGLEKVQYRNDPKDRISLWAKRTNKMITDFFFKYYWYKVRVKRSIDAWTSARSPP